MALPPPDRIYVFCKKLILPGHERTTIQGLDYHSRCYDRKIQRIA